MHRKRTATKRAQNKNVTMKQNESLRGIEDTGPRTTATDIPGLLQYIDRYGNPGDAPQRLKDATNLYLIAENGIDVSGYLKVLPGSHPHRNEFQRMLNSMRRETNGEAYYNTLFSSMQLAKEVLRKEYPELCPESYKLKNDPAPRQELRWPEDSDFLSQGQQKGIRR